MADEKLLRPKYIWSGIIGTYEENVNKKKMQ